MSSTKFYFWTIRLFYKCPWMGKYVFFKKNSSVKKHKKEINLPQNCFNRFGRLEIGLFLFRCGGGGNVSKDWGSELSTSASLEQLVGGWEDLFRQVFDWPSKAYLRRKYLCTADLQFYLFGIVVALLMLKNNRFICLVESNPSKQDVSCTVIHSL